MIMTVEKIDPYSSEVESKEPVLGTESTQQLTVRDKVAHALETLILDHIFRPRNTRKAAQREAEHDR